MFWTSGRDQVIRLYLKIREEFVRSTGEKIRIYMDFHKIKVY